MLSLPRVWKTLPKYLTGQEIDELYFRRRTSPSPSGCAIVQCWSFSTLGSPRFRALPGSNRRSGPEPRNDSGRWKGNKQRIVPVGREAIAAVDTYISIASAGTIKGRNSRYLFVTARGGKLTRQGSGNRYGLWDQGGAATETGPSYGSGTASRRICWKEERIFVACRPCSGMRTLPPRRFIPM